MEVLESGWTSVMGGEILVREDADEAGGRGEEVAEKTAGSTASMSTVVQCRLNGYLLQSRGGDQPLWALERVSDVPFESLVDQEFQIGEGDTFPGLELSLKYMVRDRPHKMRSTAKFAYSDAGRPGIPPNTPVEYEVVVTRLGFADDGDDGKSEAQQSIALRKDCGNRWFAFADYSKAGRSYSKGLQQVDAVLGAEGLEDDVLQAVASLRLALLTNLASCHLGNKEFAKAKEVCVSVLELDPGNKKGLLRAARAALAMHEHDECRLCLQRLLEEEPGNAAALLEMRRLKEAVRASLVSETTFAKNIIKANLNAASPSAIADAVANAPSSHQKQEEDQTPSRSVVYLYGGLSLLLLLVAIGWALLLSHTNTELPRP